MSPAEETATHRFPPMEPFYRFAGTEAAKLTTDVHRRLVGPWPPPDDLRDALARLVDVTPDAATRLGELGSRLLAADHARVARRLVDAMASAADETRYRLRVARSRAHAETAAGGSGRAVLEQALAAGENDPEVDPTELHHILAHGLADYAAFAEDVDAGRLAVDVADRIPVDEGRDDAKGRVVRRLAMRNDTEPTTADLVEVAEGAAAGLHDAWERMFTEVRLALAHRLLGATGVAEERWAAVAADLPAEAPLGLPGAVLYGSLFQARMQAGARGQADTMARVLKGEFHAATRDFTSALMQSEATDDIDVPPDVLERMDASHTRMTAAVQALAGAARSGDAPALLRDAEALLVGLPSPHPMADMWRLVAESAYGLGEDRLGWAAWQTAIVAAGHQARQVGATLRQLMETELAIASVTGDAAFVESAARRLRQAQGPAEAKEAAMAEVLFLDLQIRLEAADGVTYFYE